MPGNIRIPNNNAFLLAGIQTQHGYKDETSLEPRTGVTKRKYKLAGNIVPTLGIYTFFIMTTQQQACEMKVTVKIEEGDWDNRRHIRGTGYLDIKRIEAMTKAEVLGKCTDAQNQFLCVGKLVDSKYEELQNLTSRTHQTNRPLSIDQQNLIKQALDDAGISETLLRNMGLA